MTDKTSISSSQSVTAMYDKTADDYDKMMDGEISHAIYSRMFDRLTMDIRGVSGAIVDAPCGSGHMLEMYRDKYDASRDMVGVDISPQMIEISKRRLGEGARLLVGDIRELSSIESDSAAAVICYFGFHHLDEAGISAALREWHRILVVGGKVIVATWEGEGAIDYGDAEGLVAVRYSLEIMSELLVANGFAVSYSLVEPVEDMFMDAVYIDGRKDS